MKQHNLKSFNGFEKTNRSVGHLFSFLLPQKLNRRTNVVLAYNGRVLPKWGIVSIKAPLKALLLNTVQMFIKCTSAPILATLC